MAALTTTRNGDWHDAGVGTTPWAALTGSGAGGVPGDGDTVTISHNVTVTSNLTVGSSPSTGGTPAIAFGTVTGKSLTIADGLTIVLKGDLRFNGSSGGVNTLSCGAGINFKFLPASGQRYGFRSDSGGDAGGAMVFAGTSGARNTVWTDKSLGGLSSYHTTIDFHPFRLVATYTDFTDLGSTDVYGLMAIARSASTSVTVTDNTFTRCNFFATGSVNMANDSTISRNIFTDSVLRTDTGVSESVWLGFLSTATGIATISDNSFDKKVYFSDFTTKMRFTGNYVGTTVGFAGTSTWDTKSYFANNVIGAAQDLSIYGPHTGNYFVNTQSDNPHFIVAGVNAAANLIENAIFEATGNTGSITDQGDCVLSGANDCVITGCISLPTYGTANRGAGKLFTLFGSTAGKLSAGHNTGFHGAAYSEDTNATAGDIGYFKDNLIWYDSAGMTKLRRVGTGPTDVADPATVLNNAGWNTTATQNGYEGDWSVVPGSTDVSLSADPFVDKTRCLATWAAMKGQATTAAAAKSLIAANPLLITEADTGLLDWVRAGFKITASSLKDAGSDGVTIGAMEYVASGGGRGMGSKYGHTLLRP